MLLLDGLMCAYCHLVTWHLQNYWHKIIRLRAHFPDNQIKSIRFDNAAEFSSQSFYGYCLAIGIRFEQSVTHAHTLNGLTESLIKRV